MEEQVVLQPRARTRCRVKTMHHVRLDDMVKVKDGERQGVIGSVSNIELSHDVMIQIKTESGSQITEPMHNVLVLGR